MSKGQTLNIDGQEIELKWYFWDKQLEALEALSSGEYDIVNFRGGYGSGKSILGARYIQKVVLAIPDGRSLVMGQDFSKSEGTSFKVFFEQLPGEDTVDKDGERGDPENSPIVTGYNRNKRRLTFFNGHVVKLGSGADWNREAGAEYNAIWCDEVAHYEETNLFKLNEMLISRQRTEQGPNQTLWTSTGNGFNQYYDFVHMQETPSGDPLPTKIKNVVADSRNNPFLSEKNKLKRQFEGTSREIEALQGGFVAAEGLVYNAFSRDRNVIPSKEADQLATQWRSYGYDSGWNHPRVVVEVGRTRQDQYVVLDMFHATESVVEDAIDWLEGKRRGRVYCEHEPDHVKKFNRSGYIAKEAKKSLETGIPIMRDRFGVDESGMPGILIAERCEPLIKEVMSYKENHVGTSGGPDDALDALRYAIVSEELRAQYDGAHPDIQPRFA